MSGAFPEPLAEVLARENAKLRAEVERLRRELDVVNERRSRELKAYAQRAWRAEARLHTITEGKILGFWCSCGATFGKDSSLAVEHVTRPLDGLDPSVPATENADVSAVREAMHAERAEKDTRRVDCWACEAAQSEAVGILLGELRKTQALLAQAQDVFDIAVPNSEDQRAAWRRFFQQRLDELDAGQSTQTVASDGPSDH